MGLPILMKKFQFGLRDSRFWVFGKPILYVGVILSHWRAASSQCSSLEFCSLLNWLNLGELGLGGSVRNRREMGDHLVVRVDRLTTSDNLKSVQGTEVSETGGKSHDHVAESSNSVGQKDLEEDGVQDEEQPLIQGLECRICQEEDSVKNLEVPCKCSGSLKYAHRKCVQKWCNEKGDTICEICHQTYQPGYTAPPPRTEDTAIDISGEWTVSGSQLDLNDPRLLAMAAAERHLLEAEYDEYADSNANGAAFFRSAALILMALLLLRHALYVTNPDEEDDISTFFSLFLLRAAGFLLPCYIMAWAISILQRRRRRQEAAALAAGEVAYVIQAGQHSHRGLHFTIAPGPAVAHHPDPHPLP